MIVCKFGGTSLCDAACFFRVAQILREDESRRVVVPSAPGKRSAKDEKVTDLLLQCHQAARAGEDHAPLFARIRERYAAIAQGIGFGGMLDEALNAIERELPRASRDWTLSRGEYLNGLLLAALLGWSFCDAAEAVFFSPDGRCDLQKTRCELRARMPETGGLVLPGFYGAAADGSIRTFPRGGSDVTGAIAAQALNATLYENWTDVPGVFAADPRIVPDARPIASMSCRELRELSAAGAGVLQEEAVLPVRDAGIPLAVRSTLDSAALGTLILPQRDGAAASVTGVTGRRGFIPIRVEKTLLRADRDAVSCALGALSAFGVTARHLQAGTDALTMVIAETALIPCRDALLNALRQALGAERVETGAPMALLAVVGGAVCENAARILSALSCSGISINMLECAAGGLTLTVGISDDDFEAAVRAVYQDLFA